MKQEQIIHLDRFSLVDGSVEQIQASRAMPTYDSFEPIFEEYIVQVLTFEGLEDRVQKRIIGFKKNDKKRSEHA